MCAPYYTRVITEQYGGQYKKGLRVFRGERRDASRAYTVPSSAVRNAKRRSHQSNSLFPRPPLRSRPLKYS